MLTKGIKFSHNENEMPKKTTIFIIILALVTAGLIYLAIRTQQPPVTDETQPAQPGTEEEGQAEPTARLYFENSQVTASPGAQMSADILLDSGGQQAAGAQLFLQYDPTQLTINSVAAPQDNFFGASQNEYVVIVNNIDEEEGVAEFTISTPPGVTPTKPLTGIDRVATVTFTPSFTQGAAAITIVNNPNDEANTSIITSPEFLTDNILLETTPLQITIQ